MSNAHDDAKSLDKYSDVEISTLLDRATLYDIALAWIHINKQIIGILGAPPP